MAKLLRNSNIQITHAHGFFGAVMGVVASILAGIKCRFVHVHTSFYNLSKKNIYLNKWISLKATKVIYVSNISREAFLAQGYGRHKKSIVIYNCIEMPKGELGSNSSEDIIITVASLYKHKGIKNNYSSDVSSCL